MATVVACGKDSGFIQINTLFLRHRFIMTEIRNDFAPNEETPSESRNKGQEDLSSALFTDPQM